MKRFLTIIFVLASWPIFAQDAVSVFNRLLILDEEGKLLLVKVENADFWVTPGLYQTKGQTIKEGLDSLAATYDITLSDITLNGVFVLQRDLNGNTSTSLRNVFSAKWSAGGGKLPSGIDEIRWLPLDEAMTIMTFPHINAMIAQVFKDTGKVWGGTLLQYKEEDQFKSKIIEEFYPLSHHH